MIGGSPGGSPSRRALGSVLSWRATLRRGRLFRTDATERVPSKRHMRTPPKFKLANFSSLWMGNLIWSRSQVTASMNSDELSNGPISAGQLKRLKVFVDMTDEQAATFIGMVEPLQARANQIIVKMGDPGDSMYFLLEGDVRVSQLVEDKETIIATLEAGDFFGEMCLFDEVRRSADVVAARPCALLRISQDAFERIQEEHPLIAIVFLRAIIRARYRMRKLNKKHVDSMMLARQWNPAVGARSAARFGPRS